MKRSIPASWMTVKRLLCRVTSRCFESPNTYIILVSMHRLIMSDDIVMEMVKGGGRVVVTSVNQSIQHYKFKIRANFH